MLPTIESMYCVSSKVFLGTTSVLNLCTSSSVFRSANLQQEELVGGLEEELVGGLEDELVGGLEEELVGRSLRSGRELDEREELETVLLGAFEAEPKALLEVTAVLLSA